MIHGMDVLELVSVASVVALIGLTCFALRLTGDDDG